MAVGLHIPKIATSVEAIDELTQQAYTNYRNHLNKYRQELPGNLSSVLNTGNLRNYIKSDANVRNAVLGVLFVLMQDKIADSGDQSYRAKAIRRWATKIYKSLNTASAKSNVFRKIANGFNHAKGI